MSLEIPLSEMPSSFRISYLDYPMALRAPKYTPEEMVEFYDGSMMIFLPRNFLPISRSPYKNAAIQVFNALTPKMLEQERWKNYQVRDMGDMTVATHSLRQGGTTALALLYDSLFLHIPHIGRDRTIAAAVLHDAGEIVTTDITYDQKQGDKRTMELAESSAVMKMLDEQACIGTDMQKKLKEIYLRITTSLGIEDMSELLGRKISPRGAEKWLQLRELFNLYERYGYLLTALQQWPFQPSPFDEDTPNIAPFDLERMQKWNRPELEAAIAQREAIPDQVKAAALFKNVILNQWPHIQRARAQGIPSARAFFSDKWSRLVIESADDIMGLRLTN